ncbi:hypothetical protein Ahy_A09g044824 isoform D [Arachis hypogaea]|uniref:Uncharacterized protein n=1 Tax=Arachis hypogaea TaxID=3818 RepID=A0A445BKW8_ARAHY|nr:hypothetical protein Ahy_A09g044824 isoform D [Arachis hypogaea]
MRTTISEPLPLCKYPVSTSDVLDYVMFVGACLHGVTGGVLLLPEPPRGAARNRCCPASAILRFNIHWPGNGCVTSRGTASCLATILPTVSCNCDIEICMLRLGL